MKKTIYINDSAETIDKLSMGSRAIVNNRMSAGPVKTEITIRDADTKEVLQVVHNKTLIPGSQAQACKQFGILPVLELPTYNSELGLENSLDPYSTQPINEPITCLWCAGRGGFGTSPNEVFVVSNIDRIEPKDDIMPFRYCDPTNDIDKELRDTYFGRKIEENGKISYYFKTFDTEPQLHIRYLDGTEVTDKMWSIDSTQQIEVYVEMRLLANRLDFRDYIDQVLGWDKADFSTVSLLTAWYTRDIIENPDAPAEDQLKYRWYQDVLPFSKFNFKAEDLSSLNRAIEFCYRLYY